MDVKEIGPDRAEELETLVGNIRSKLRWIAQLNAETEQDANACLEDLIRYSVELDRIKRNR